MLSKRNTIIIVITLLVLALSGVMLTLALLTDRRQSANTFTFGEVKVTLEEATAQNQNLVLGSFIRRQPVVKNDGEDCYVRATITVSDIDNDQSIMEFIELSDLGDGWYINETGADGSWNETNKVTVYYNTVLEKDKKTSKIFEGFTLQETNAQGQQLLPGFNNAFNIDIAVEAVQAGKGRGIFNSPEEAFAELYR